jgi:hypothetical protein
MQETDKRHGPVPPWMIGPETYQAWRGVHQPWIAEISPFQMGEMSKRQKAAYQKKRSAEWKASGDCKAEWADRVEAAYRLGLIDQSTPGLPKETQDCLFWIIDANEKAAAKEKRDRQLEDNQIKDLSELQAGMRVFCPIYQYGVVIKINRKTAKVRFKGCSSEFWDTNLTVNMLQRQKSTDIEA